MDLEPESCRTCRRGEGVVRDQGHTLEREQGGGHRARRAQFRPVPLGLLSLRARRQQPCCGASGASSLTLLLGSFRFWRFPSGQQPLRFCRPFQKPPLLSRCFAAFSSGGGRSSSFQALLRARSARPPSFRSPAVEPRRLMPEPRLPRAAACSGPFRADSQRDPTGSGAHLKGATRRLEFPGESRT